MSRHVIPALSDRFSVTVGWDRPMNSYFAQVEDLEIDSDTSDPMLVWVGTSHSEIPHPEALQRHIARYAAIPDGMLETLRADRAATLDRGDTRLQRDMQIFVERSENTK
jgi:hypothetical protein